MRILSVVHIPQINTIDAVYLQLKELVEGGKTVVYHGGIVIALQALAGPYFNIMVKYQSGDIQTIKYTLQDKTPFYVANGSAPDMQIFDELFEMAMNRGFNYGYGGGGGGGNAVPVAPAVAANYRLLPGYRRRSQKYKTNSPRGRTRSRRPHHKKHHTRRL